MGPKDGVGINQWSQLSAVPCCCLKSCRWRSLHYFYFYMKKKKTWNLKVLNRAYQSMKGWVSVRRRCWIESLHWAGKIDRKTDTVCDSLPGPSAGDFACSRPISPGTPASSHSPKHTFGKIGIGKSVLFFSLCYPRDELVTCLGCSLPLAAPLRNTAVDDGWITNVVIVG